MSVSIGIPCHNRAALLERALRAVLAQTHTDLEIIISDNASTDPAVERLCREIAGHDKRVVYHRQPLNLGAMGNFTFVLEQATKPFFMWAADDDWIEPNFVANCLDVFHRGGAELALVAPEAQYETPDGNFPYFPEGEALRALPAVAVADYPASVFPALFGSLIYGLFRRDALFHNGVPLNSWIGTSLNELPFFVLLATKGRIVSLDWIGLHKRAPLGTCRTAEWERRGGVARLGPALLSPARALKLIRYHRLVLAEVTAAVHASDLGASEKNRTIDAAKTGLARHLRQVLIGWKPRAGVPAHSASASSRQDAQSSARAR